MSPFPTPCKGKSKNQSFAHTFALTGRRRLYIDTQGVALGSGLAALSGRSRRGLQCTLPLKGAHISNFVAGQAPPTICAPYRGSSENRWAATRDRGEPLSWNMSPFQGQFPPPPSAQQFVNSFNSLLRRPRPTSNRGAAPQPPCSNSINSSAAPSPPSYISILLPLLFPSSSRKTKSEPLPPRFFFSLYTSCIVIHFILSLKTR